MVDKVVDDMLVERSNYLSLLLLILKVSRCTLVSASYSYLDPIDAEKVVDYVKLWSYSALQVCFTRSGLLSKRQTDLTCNCRITKKKN